MLDRLRTPHIALMDTPRAAGAGHAEEGGWRSRPRGCGGGAPPGRAGGRWFAVATAPSCTHSLTHLLVQGGPLRLLLRLAVLGLIGSGAYYASTQTGAVSCALARPTDPTTAPDPAGRPMTQRRGRDWCRARRSTSQSSGRSCCQPSPRRVASPRRARRSAAPPGERPEQGR
eukprot:scaffold2156_cov430-Prasinococcus_capsulatus_cf.AAC.5